MSIFITAITSPEEIPAARRLIESLREFGGTPGQSPVRVFIPDGYILNDPVFHSAGVEIVPLKIPQPLQDYPFSAKVAACAAAEEQAPTGTSSLVWIDPLCLVINPPVLYELDAGCDAAVRPVHVRNIGLRWEDPPDEFWAGIFRAAGVQDAGFPINSFIDDTPVRAYFNSHGFSFRPGIGLGRRWMELFSRLVKDQSFQETTCVDMPHRIFLFQAVWSVLVASTVVRKRIRILPPDYNYPYNLHDRVPEIKRPRRMNDLVTMAYETRRLDPDSITDIKINEPLRTWLKNQINS
jgi:hypothetical protein